MKILINYYGEKKVLYLSRLISGKKDKLSLKIVKTY